MAYLAIILLSIGLIFLFVELFMPGFGVFGGAGLIFLIASAVLTIIYIPYGAIIVISELIIIFIIGFLLLDHIRRNGLYGKIVLKDTLNEDTNNEENLSVYIGKEGVAKTPLRPCGNVVIDGKTIEAYSDGEFILADDKIKAVKVFENKLYVKKIKKWGKV